MTEIGPEVEVWGGVECTINRVGDRFFDQGSWSGHRERVEEDLQRIAGLGIRTLRVGLQWERYVETGSWEEFDRELGAMQRLGLRPIGGLLHHGSGPRGTGLLDPEFPERLAAYALEVATRYPWLLDYTPVNEPQTTGRFSCLYGHWYPHHRTMESYLRSLVYEMKGVVLAMEAIRSVQPEARLIHTEDAGQTFATAPLAGLAAEREQRRWLGVDLLCGRVTEEHPMFRRLEERGIAAEEILWFSEHVCPPAVVGLNHYLTSDRVLDHRVELYPEAIRGGDSGTEPLVDIEAVRVRPEGLVTTEAILTEAWERYGLPVAITEAHLGGAVEDQIRWLAEVWRGARAARARGVEVRAVTVWALLGSWNWSCLCTEDLQQYEPGVFDTTGGALEETELAGAVRQMAEGGAVEHAALREAGWWSREDRLLFPPYLAEAVRT